ncbi:GNAT family N-acetyltransferase [Pantoea sp. KPR_PJ]|uniref:GNAT family N-acetyltransferase n=1 Tax=Pantoea sp. KPR_PJ TaxID=2738375 RepID=UPI003526FACA
MYWESERLLYRPVRMSDVDALFRIYGDVRTHAFNPRGPHQSIEESRRVILQRAADRERYGFDDWAVAEKCDPQRVIGFGGVFVSEFNGEQTNNLGYRFEPAAWGRGYATELARRALSYAFDELKLADVVGVTRENHLASRRVLEKAGLVLTQRIENLDDPPANLMFTLTREAWTRRKQCGA